jgi:acyl dehydratase
MTTITGMDGLRAALGTDLGVTDWREITQAEVDAFADATGDHQWIHVDPARAAQSPLGGTIAHGLYTLSLAPALTSSLLSFDGFAFALNYGYNRVRFPAPLPVGARVRMRAALAAVDDIPGGAQITIVQTFEREGSDKPVCVVESVARLYVGEGASDPT